MKKKINVLIIAAILGLIALSVIQGYLINNTYKLKKDAFISETRKSVSKIDDFSPALDSLTDFWRENFLEKLADYKIGVAKKNDVVDGLEFVIDSINDTYRKEYQKELVKKNIPYGIKFHKKVKAVIVLDSVQNDTLFDTLKAPKQIIIGDLIEEENAIRISTTSWETEHTSNRVINDVNQEVSFYLLFLTEDEIDIAGWKNIVFKQMLGLLLLSLLIFAFVIGLLYYSIKSLITQKKIADIKTDFVNNITHELKTPLATLTLATKMLKNDNVKQQHQLMDNTVSTIERQNKRLQKLIDQVLNNSLGYSEISLQKETIDIESYVNTVLDDFLLSVTNKNVTVNRTFNIEKQNITLDKFYTTTALLNILENAVKYNTEPVVISCSIESKNELKIKISDNGIGISEKNQKLIFEKFFRAGNKEVHDVKGLGLGLYYTNQIVKAHGGSIKLDSKPEKGSSFTLTIPFN
ncbi:sensor histidine kinase [Winogradskyella jejuensis]|uniref:histidine kinase n=1 Tax=Winogradskyella jejuensis TaxID=1089305 RepID=A0A1M5MJX5_9FLAO|nr:HAMP domain-containing sensor histidine kinase [Winogradskyella jejuensis]SHG77536.1 His Kinase A (phospho-acceptor) domain-containing protein [Winogradskyella jejuensis]